MKINLFNKPEQIITVLEIGKKWLKVVQAEGPKEAARICHIDALEIGSFSDKELTEKIADLAVRLRINSENLLVSIPHVMTSTKILNLPSTNLTEIEDMVSLQIEKQTPYSGDEIVKDYQILDSSRDGYSKVLLVVAHLDAVRRLFKIGEEAGLFIERVGFSLEGFLDWIRSAYPKAISSGKAAIFIEIDYETVDFAVAAGGKLIFKRNFPSELSTISSSLQAWQDKFTQEVTRSLYAYQNEIIDKEAGQIIISVPEPIVKKINQEVLEKEVGLPVKVVGQLGEIKKTDKVLPLYNKVSENNLSFASLIGAALTFGKQKIDLVPQAVKMERGVKERGQDIYRIGMISVLILLILSGLFLGRLYNQERYLNQIESKLLEGEEKRDVLSEKFRKMEVARDRISARDLSLDLIYYVNEAVPFGVRLIDLVFSQEQGVVLRGNSESMDKVFNFVNALEGLEHFSGVEARYTERRTERGRDFVNFEIFSPLSEHYRYIYRD